NAEAANCGGLLAEAPERIVAQPRGIALAILGKLYDYPRDHRRQWVFAVGQGHSRACRSADRSWRYGRTGRPLQLQRLHDDRELADARLGEVLEHEVLEQMDTVDGKRDVVDR